ncbi:MAG: membrane protein insertase YidC [Chromatiales bacterium]|nr:membrane protein insertase YidC [Chromatiales bacterium]
MDNLRIVLWVGVALMLWITWETWRADQARAPAERAAITEADEDAALDALLELPELPRADTAQAADPDLPAVPGAVAEPAAPEAIVRIVTDVLDLELNLNGGDLRGATLPKFPVRKDDPDNLVRLLNRDPATLYIFRTGLRAGDDQPEPNHRALFTAERSEFRLEPGATELVVPLRWESNTGISVTKTWTFRPGRYDVQLEYLVENRSAEAWRAASYLQIQRRHIPPARSLFNVESYSFRGPVISDGRAFDKLNVDDLARNPVTEVLAGGWLAALEHHFLTAIVPPRDEVHTLEARAREGVFLLTAIGPVRTVAPGDQSRFEAQLFVGPKLQAQLAEVAPGLERTVDYGMLAILAQPLFWLLDNINRYVGNWGWSIIIVTVIIKLVFYKLTEISGRSMAKMRKLQPRLKALQERYKDDRQAMSQALMEMYKREKINPAAGCLPMLVQIPFFIAFYWVLLESVEMRQAPFMLWITDLSARDPFFILPLCMGAAMYVQQKLNPAPPDPIQAKVMAVLPWVFTVFFAFFPAGLVLYWLTNSLLSILQQWRINKVVGAD